MTDYTMSDLNKKASEFASTEELAQAVSRASQRGDWYDGPGSTSVLDWIAEGDIDPDRTVADLAEEWDE